MSKHPQNMDLSGADAVIGEAGPTAEASALQKAANRKALLDVIAYAEGTSTSGATRCDGYDVIVTGADGELEVFTDFTTHPFANGRKSKLIKVGKDGRHLLSNASGRYQFMLKDYRYYKGKLGLADFGPGAQERWAIQLIEERHAWTLIEAGQFEEAIVKISNLWASLPGANYRDQGMREMEKLRQAYLRFGGALQSLP